jgi:hypothetical protein
MMSTFPRLRRGRSEQDLYLILSFLASKFNWKVSKLRCVIQFVNSQILNKKIGETRASRRVAPQPETPGWSFWFAIGSEFPVAEQPVYGVDL